jgi:hypothetical protein
MLANCCTTKKALRNALTLGLLVLATGCGSRGIITGKVNHQGKAMPGGMVIFIHERKGAFSAQIKEDGSYKIADVPSGAVKIGVLPPAVVKSAWHGAPPTDADLEKLQAGLPKEQPRISNEALKEKMGIRPAPPKGKAVHLPEKYGDPEQSGLTYTVIGGPQTHDINLD